MPLFVRLACPQCGTDRGTTPGSKPCPECGYRIGFMEMQRLMKQARQGPAPQDPQPASSEPRKPWYDRMADQDRERKQRKLMAKRPELGSFYQGHQCVLTYKNPEELRTDAQLMQEHGWEIDTIDGQSYRSMGGAAAGLFLAGPVGALLGARRKQAITVVYRRE